MDSSSHIRDEETQETLILAWKILIPPHSTVSLHWTKNDTASNIRYPSPNLEIHLARWRIAFQTLWFFFYVLRRAPFGRSTGN